MFANPHTRAIVRQVTLACFVGVLLSLPAFSTCFDIAGAGHGSNFAFYLFFGPDCLAWLLPPKKSGTTFTELWLLVSGMLGLYGLYGGVLAYARSKRVGLWALLAILCVHYGAVVWVATGFTAGDRFSNLAATLAEFSIMRSVVTAELFVVLHLIAFQYATSEPPFWPRMTWSVAGMLAIGLLAGVTLYAWGLSMG